MVQKDHQVFVFAVNFKLPTTGICLVGDGEIGEIMRSESLNQSTVAKSMIFQTTATEAAVCGSINLWSNLVTCLD